MSLRFFCNFVRYLVFAITPTTVHSLGSFFSIMRISSSAKNCFNGVCFCWVVFVKLPCKFDPFLNPEADDGQVWSFSEV